MGSNSMTARQPSARLGRYPTGLRGVSIIAGLFALTLPAQAAAFGQPAESTESPPHPVASQRQFAGQDAPTASGADQPSDDTHRGGVVGSVTDARGRPVEGAFVQATGVGPNAKPVPDLAVFTDASGVYHWPLPPGDYEIVVKIDGFSPIIQQVTVIEGRAAGLDFVVR